MAKANLTKVSRGALGKVLSEARKKAQRSGTTMTEEEITAEIELYKKEKREKLEKEKRVKE